MDDELLSQLDPLDLDRTLGRIVSHFHADSGTIHLIGDDGHLHLRAATPGIPPFVLDKVRIVPIGKGMAGLAMERNEPVNACNIQTDTSGDVKPGARATGMQGAIVVPIRRGSAAIGTLGIANREERTFSDQEIELLIHAGARLA